jgi:hypothetical protein
VAIDRLKQKQPLSGAQTSRCARMFRAFDGAALVTIGMTPICTVPLVLKIIYRDVATRICNQPAATGSDGPG